MQIEMAVMCKTDAELLEMIYKTSPHGKEDKETSSENVWEGNVSETAVINKAVEKDMKEIPEQESLLKENEIKQELSDNFGSLAPSSNVTHSEDKDHAAKVDSSPMEITDDGCYKDETFDKPLKNSEANHTDNIRQVLPTVKDENKSRTHEAPSAQVGDSCNAELYLLTKEELVNKLISCREELNSLRKQLSRSERQLAKCDDYNELLCEKVETLSSQIHTYKKGIYTETAIQVDQNDLINFTIGEPCMPDWGVDETQGLAHPSTSTTGNLEQNDSKMPDDSGMSIADSIKMAAQDVVNKQTQDTLLLQGYVYDETYGLYYHSQSGYYYDSEKMLYYEPHSGTYYYYDYDTGQYTFHSQVNIQDSQYGYGYGETTKNTQNTKVTNSSYKSSTSKKKKMSESRIRKAGGKVTEQFKPSSTDLNACILDFEDLTISKDSRSARKLAIDFAQAWRPCVRVIVSESDCIDVGMLYIITYQGMSIGRGKENGICIPDINVSKFHADIKYNEEDRNYTITDKGSQNGTFINSERISLPKETSEPKAFKHGDLVQVGDTKLLCHIHSGTDTCDDCEPGIVMAKYRELHTKQEVKFISKEERKKMQRQELNQIKKRYGLKHAVYEDPSAQIKNPNYEDKAAERRKTFGSDTPHVKHETPASVHRPISSENKGHKMLEKMGWKEGESLGKDNTGIQEPISVSLRINQSAGLGSGVSGLFSVDDANSLDIKKANRRMQALQRYTEIEKSQVDIVTREVNQEKVEESDTSAMKSDSKYKMKWTKGKTEFT